MLNKDRMMGSVLGLAIGDAMGQSVEFKQRGSFPEVTGYRGGGPFGLNAGEWTDDTSMAIAFMDTVIQQGGCPGLMFNAKGLMDSWVSWYKDGKYSVNGRCFDIGGRTRSSLEHYIKTRDVPPLDNAALGNGAVMRLAPAAIMDAFVSVHRGKCLPAMSLMQGMLTHPSMESFAECESLARTLIMCFADLPIKPCGVSEKAPDLFGGKATDCMTLAKWSLGGSVSFKDAILRAANLGGDADSIGAVTGQMAGAYYGLNKIRESGLLEGLAQVSDLLEMTMEFISVVEANYKE
jgi:ADP-ribosyl-[dinitrogen reductase] hydrolase